MLEAEAWVAVAFVIFLGILIYVGAHRRVIDAIDQRQARIKSELDEAVVAGPRDRCRVRIASIRRDLGIDLPVVDLAGLAQEPALLALEGLAGS